MRIFLTTFIALTAFLVTAQDSNVLQGKYTHSFFMYRYYLTLADSGRYTVEEHSDLGSRTTYGTWALADQEIRLTPTICYSRNRTDNKPKQVPSEMLEASILSIADDRALTLLAPKKKTWWDQDGNT